LTILAKKSPFIFVVVNFNEEIIVGSHFSKMKLDKNDSLNGTKW